MHNWLFYEKKSSLMKICPIQNHLDISYWSVQHERVGPKVFNWTLRHIYDNDRFRLWLTLEHSDTAHHNQGVKIELIVRYCIKSVPSNINITNIGHSCRTAVKTKWEQLYFSFYPWAHWAQVNLWSRFWKRKKELA